MKQKMTKALMDTMMILILFGRVLSGAEESKMELSTDKDMYRGEATKCTLPAFKSVASNHSWKCTLQRSQCIT